MAGRTRHKRKPVGDLQAFGQVTECLKILAHLVRLWIVQLLPDGLRIDLSLR